MPSSALYPPTMDAYIPAFVVGENSGNLNVYFTLSRFNSGNDFTCVHAVVNKQPSGINIVNKVDGGGRFRRAGVIMNINAAKVEGRNDGTYFFTLTKDDIQDGWKPGVVYKIQVRLSNIKITEENADSQAQWMADNASHFSEWSTVCITKAIGPILVTIPALEYEEYSNTIKDANTESLIKSGTIDFSGTVVCSDDSEYLYSYSMSLYRKGEDVPLDSSGTLFSNEYVGTNQFSYNFKITPEHDTQYTLKLFYQTQNEYTSTVSVDFLYQEVVTDDFYVHVHTLDSPSLSDSIKDALSKATSFTLEDEEGRIGIKLWQNMEDTTEEAFIGNICLRRSSQKDNFKTWRDLKIYTIKAGQQVNSLPIYFDYTIESGIYYKYAVQYIDKKGRRGRQNETTTPIKRDFEFSYLLGPNNQQLKLRFDNTMDNFKLNVSDSKTDTLGGIYPFISRNGKTKYKTFPINGLISYNMDDNYTFLKKYFMDDTTEEDFQREKYNPTNAYHEADIHIGMYDYFYERLFREEVFTFLHDGKPKLFKSPTEGNLIVRLMDINTSPNRTLNRLIYSFSSTAHEIAEFTTDNLEKYNIISVGNWSSDFINEEVKLGQLILDLELDMDDESHDDIIQKIYEKYDSGGESIAGFTKTITKIHDIHIEINDKLSRTEVDYGSEKGYLYGVTMQCKNNKIVISRPYFEIDKEISFSSDDQLFFYGDKEAYRYAKKRTEDIEAEIKKLKENQPSDRFESLAQAEEELEKVRKETDARNLKRINVTIDFLYNVSTDKYVGKEIKTQDVTKTLAQYKGVTNPGFDIYKEIYYRAYYEAHATFSRLDRLISLSIECDPDAVFRITDSKDASITEEHDINFTGVLNFDQCGQINRLEYAGMRKKDGSIEEVPCDIIVTYFCYYKTGTYEVEGSEGTENGS